MYAPSWDAGNLRFLLLVMKCGQLLERSQEQDGAAVGHLGGFLPMRV